MLMERDTGEPARDPELAGRIVRLAGVRLSASTLESILQLVATEARDAVPGCAEAGVSLVRDRHATTLGATSGHVYEVDLAQYETGEGPCLDAARDQQVHRIEETDSETRWPRFAERASKLGIKSTLSLPMAVDGEPLGALNLYATRPGAFDSAGETAALALVDAAGILLDNAQSHTQAITLARQLEEALRSRAVIEQAKGILIARHGCTPDQAFDRLRMLSQRLNRKLRDVAQEIVSRSVSTD
jgi:GAF domain-containing protein